MSTVSAPAPLRRKYQTEIEVSELDRMKLRLIEYFAGLPLLTRDGKHQVAFSFGSLDQILGLIYEPGEAEDLYDTDEYGVFSITKCELIYDESALDYKYFMISEDGYLYGSIGDGANRKILQISKL